jgi:hypothetical protein
MNLQLLLTTTASEKISLTQLRKSKEAMQALIFHFITLLECQHHFRCHLFSNINKTFQHTTLCHLLCRDFHQIPLPTTISLHQCKMAATIPTPPCNHLLPMTCPTSNTTISEDPSSNLLQWPLTTHQYLTLILMPVLEAHSSHSLRSHCLKMTMPSLSRQLTTFRPGLTLSRGSEYYISA